MSKSFQTFEEICHCLLINLVKRQVPDKKRDFFYGFLVYRVFRFKHEKIQNFLFEFVLTMKSVIQMKV